MREGVSVREAQETILAATEILGAETLASVDALDRVLASPIDSTRQIPPEDCSAMDGYALRAKDAATASLRTPVELPVAFEVAAGTRTRTELRAGEAARIFTGAPVPPGADCVVRQEDTEHVGGSGDTSDRVRIFVAPPLRDNIRDAGEDLRVGERVLEGGARLGPAEIGLLAALGRTVVSVRRRPRVAILSGGDELVEPDGDITGGRIVASNSYTLSAQCRRLGAEASYLGIARDDRESVEASFRSALYADCIVSSAGVSVGDHDHVRPVLEKLGCRLDFWGVNMKPGYPLAFGRFPARDGEAPAGPLVFALPGNPVSAYVTFEQFVAPALRKMMGRTRCFRPIVSARLGDDLSKKPGRLHFVRVRLERSEGTLVARTAGSQSSGVMSSLVRADGLLIFPLEASVLSKGDTVAVQLLDDDFMLQTDGGC